MGTPASPSPPSGPGRAPRALPPFLLASLLLHGAALAWVANAPPRPAPPERQVIELAMIAPPPPAAVEPPPPPPPPVARPKAPPPVRVAAPMTPPPEPLAEREVEPPPPNEPPPPQAPKVVPIVVGLSMSSTTTAGSFAAPVGNTVYGKTADRAVEPASVKAYAGPKFMPVYQVDTAPVVRTEVKIDYPPEARRASVEGTVTLSITVDEHGKVTRAVVVSGPGHGLDEAARDAVLRFLFSPAIKDGAPVSTEMKYAYTFLLD